VLVSLRLPPSLLLSPYRWSQSDSGGFFGGTVDDDLGRKNRFIW